MRGSSRAITFRLQREGKLSVDPDVYVDNLGKTSSGRHGQNPEKADESEVEPEPEPEQQVHSMCRW